VRQFIISGKILSPLEKLKAPHGKIVARFGLEDTVYRAGQRVTEYHTVWVPDYRYDATERVCKVAKGSVIVFAEDAIGMTNNINLHEDGMGLELFLSRIEFA